ncbi:putative membrane protein [Rhodobacter aestuarii]|uniref:Protoporphyrinogen IX oxidase n=2 Tax=Rhodobacter group TaxID=3374108 RepID=A0A1N7LFD7_9RHOB|nr:putative membrane protein [Rhodobacter aestuarii]SIS72539.1 putative membrane protein [Rhodobacter aestuarii]SOC08144.1 putative membrane protein [Rhodobacter sp. JA431]
MTEILDLVSSFLSDMYLWTKSLHVMSVLAWMAGLFYLPRLYVYHVEGLKKQGVTRGSDMDLLFQHQERLLMKAIMHPAAISTWFFGLCLVFTPGVVWWDSIWPYAKGFGIIAMTIFHLYLAKARFTFIDGTNNLKGRQWRMMNEIPTLLMVLIVLAVILKF